MAALLLRSAWPKFSDFREKGLFSRSDRIQIGIFSSTLELAP